MKFDGSKGTKDLRIKGAAQQAIYFRESEELENCNLITKINQRISNKFEDMKDALNNVEEYEDCKIKKTPIQQYQHIIETLKKYSTMTVQDDEFNWNASGRKKDNGKLLLVDQADYNTLHIFFDDRAHAEDDCIIDVRDAVTKEVLPYKKFINKYVVKVEPHRAILEGDYFIKMIELIERNRDDEIDRVENGLPEEEEEEDSEEKAKQEWDALQKLSNE